MLTFYLVRHGNTVYNRDKIVTGQSDSSLTVEGLKNGHQIAERLKDIHFSAIYTSDLSRALLTAKIIADVLKVKAIITARELREIDYGIYTNQSKAEIKELCPQYKNDASYVFPGGESFYQVETRVGKFIEHLEEEHHGQTVLLVAHSGVIRSVLCHFHGWDLQEHLSMRLSHKYIGKFVIDDHKLLSYVNLEGGLDSL